MDTFISNENLSCKMNDSIHGHMEFEPLIFKIIDTPEFQRLRNIKQVTPSNLVYPSATHSRFEHSIGVCHLADQMLNDLEKHTENLLISPRHKTCVKLAALCHDLGHGPMSHSWESFVRRQQPHDTWTHEQGSVSMLRKLLSNIEHDLTEEDIEMVGNLILGYDSDSTFKVKPEHQYLFEVVNNKYCDMDVDKWDYLLRDSKYSNIATGFDHKRLLSGVSVIKSEDGSTHISYRDSDAINVSRMYMDRANLHFYCYQHKASLISEEMYLDALAVADEDENMNITLKSGKSYKLSTAHKDMEAYEQLTDCVLERIRWSGPDEAKELMKRICTRDFYKIIYTRKFSNDQDLRLITNKHTERELLTHLSKKWQIKFGLVVKTMTMGNKGKLKNTPFHNKNGDKVYEQDLQLFSQSGKPENFWYGEIIIFSKEPKRNLTDKNICEEIANQAKDYIDNLLSIKITSNGF